MRSDHGGVPAARIDASVNVNPLGPPRSLDRVFARARELASRYPELDASAGRRAWAERLGVAEGEVLIGNGASELLSLVLRAWTPRRVHVFAPTYSEYEAAAQAAGAEVSRVPLVRDGAVWRTPLAGLAPAPGDAVVVCTPNNPTGHLTPPAEVLALAQRHPDVLILADESFLGFHPDADTLTLARPGVPANLAVVRSLTKLYCVPGLRLGVLRADAGIVRRIRELRDPWPVNALAAEVAVLLAEEDSGGEYLAGTRAWAAEERGRVGDLLGEVRGLTVCGSDAPYLLCELPEDRDVAALASALAAVGIAVRDASTFPGLGPRWFRVGLRSREENDEVVSAVRSFLESR